MLSKVIARLIAAVFAFPFLFASVWVFWQERPSFLWWASVFAAGVLVSIIFDWAEGASIKALRKVGEWLSRK